MEYVIAFIVMIIVILLYMKINEVQKQLESQQMQIDNLCKITGNLKLASDFISDEEKEHIIQLKNTGREVEAIKKVREATSMDLVQAKQYVDKLWNLICWVNGPDSRKLKATENSLVFLIAKIKK